MQKPLLLCLEGTRWLFAEEEHEISPFVLIHTETHLTFLEACLRCGKTELASPPLIIMLQLYSPTLTSTFYISWSLGTLFDIYLHLLHFPSSKPPYCRNNVNPWLLLGICMPCYLLRWASPMLNVICKSCSQYQVICIHN